MLQGKATRSVAALSALVLSASLAVGCSGSKSSDTTRDATPKADLILSVKGDAPVAKLDPRFQSYNVEMVEVTGGEFWKPYDAGPGKVVRDPIDLSSERLRNLARGLGPVYIRVSGTWANRTYFDVDARTGGVAPQGFGGVLSTEQWKAVGAFAKAVDGQIVTSFASDVGVRDANGVWNTDQARALLAFSRDNDIPVVAAEMFNEPTLPIGLPPGYAAADFARDLTALKKVVAEEMPDLKIVGPGAAADVTPVVLKPSLPAVDIMKAVGDAFDVFSYHFYPKVSARCGSPEGPEVALKREFLSRVDASKRFYEKLRDTYVPGAPMWVTETAQAACGGDRWAAQYMDVIRYVDTLGRLVDGNGDVVFHNTLAASDYGLLDENGFVPRPDYWAAVLWHRLMGTEVLKPASTPPGGVDADVSVYARCAPKGVGGTSYAVVNASKDKATTVATRSGRATVYLLTGPKLDGTEIRLGGKVLEAAADGKLPKLDGKSVEGAVEVPPASVAFVVEPASAGGPCV